MSRGVVALDGLLRAPLTGISGSLELDGTLLRAKGVEARCGRTGHIKLRGALPLRPVGSGGVGGGGSTVVGAEGLVAEASGLELRVRSAYSGLLDATVRVAGSLAAPVVGGELKLSKGTVYLVGQAGGGGGGGGGAGAAEAAVAMATGAGRGAEEEEMVSRAFAALKAGRRRAHDQVGVGMGVWRGVVQAVLAWIASRSWCSEA